MVHKAINIYSLAPYKEPLQPIQHLLHWVALSLVCKPEPLNLCLVPMLDAELLANCLTFGLSLYIGCIIVLGTLRHHLLFRNLKLKLVCS